LNAVEDYVSSLRIVHRFVDDALRMFDAGASLLQVYTGFIYQGPGLIRRINQAVQSNSVK